MRAAAITILLRAAAACVFCPHDVTLDDEIDFDAICTAAASGACAGPWSISSDAEATAKAALGCSVVGSSVTLNNWDLSTTGLAQLSGLTHVCDSLVIQQLSLESLAGLENLAFVRGDVHIRQNPVVTTSTPLTSLAELGLKYVGGSIKVENNPDIAQLDNAYGDIRYAVVGDPGNSHLKYYPGESGSPTTCDSASCAAAGSFMCAASNANCEPHPWAPTPRPTSTPTPRPTPQPHLRAKPAAGAQTRCALRLCPLHLC